MTSIDFLSIPVRGSGFADSWFRGIAAQLDAPTMAPGALPFAAIAESAGCEGA